MFLLLPTTHNARHTALTSAQETFEGKLDAEAIDAVEYSLPLTAYSTGGFPHSSHRISNRRTTHTKRFSISWTSSPLIQCRISATTYGYDEQIVSKTMELGRATNLHELCSSFWFGNDSKSGMTWTTIAISTKAATFPPYVLPGIYC